MLLVVLVHYITNYLMYIYVNVLNIIDIPLIYLYIYIHISLLINLITCKPFRRVRLIWSELFA